MRSRMTAHQQAKKLSWPSLFALGVIVAPRQTISANQLVASLALMSALKSAAPLPSSGTSSHSSDGVPCATLRARLPTSDSSSHVTRACAPVSSATMPMRCPDESGIEHSDCLVHEVAASPAGLADRNRRSPRSPRVWSGSCAASRSACPRGPAGGPRTPRGSAAGLLRKRDLGGRFGERDLRGRFGERDLAGRRGFFGCLRLRHRHKATVVDGGDFLRRLSR